MNDCSHDWQGSKPDVRMVVDFWHGFTDALVCCPDCGQYALLRVVHWQGPRLALRVFAFLPVAPDPVAVFLRNMKSDYCDLSRHEAEWQALVASAFPVSHYVVMDMDTMIVLLSLPISVASPAPPRSWRERAPATDDPGWNSVLSQYLPETNH